MTTLMTLFTRSLSITLTSVALAAAAGCPPGKFCIGDCTEGAPEATSTTQAGTDATNGFSSGGTEATGSTTAPGGTTTGGASTGGTGGTTTDAASTGSTGGTTTDAVSTDGTAGTTGTTAAGTTTGTTTADTTTGESSTTAVDPGTSTGDASTGDASTGTGEDLFQCTLPWPENSAIVGTTPFGPFEGRFAGFADISGDCSELTIWVLEDAPQTIDDVWNAPLLLNIRAFTWDNVNHTYVGEGPAGVMIAKNKQKDQAGGAGTVKITTANLPQADPPPFIAEGTLSVQGNGWSLAGPFKAAYCVDFALICP